MAKQSAPSKRRPRGHTLTSVEEQYGKYGKNVLDIYGKSRDPLPFANESTGVETPIQQPARSFTKKLQRLRVSQIRKITRTGAT